jgi:hypothetical protein
MSAKAIREFHGKKLLSRWLEKGFDLEDRALLIAGNSLDPTDPESFQTIANQVRPHYSFFQILLLLLIFLITFCTPYPVTEPVGA